jgi:putative NIF3 family GTP cyclohydrolase 1 type 2
MADIGIHVRSYPEELADRAWDNVGLLQENIEPAAGSVPRRVLQNIEPACSSVPPRVLLTNDLTVDVAEEAIAKKVSVIVSYRATTTHHSFDPVH